MAESIFVREISNEVRSVFADGFQIPDLLSILGVVMRVIQHKPEMKGKGALKKEVAILVFEMLLKETGWFTGEQAEEASRFLVYSLPTLIDSLKKYPRVSEQKQKSVGVFDFFSQNPKKPENKMLKSIKCQSGRG